MSKGDLDIGHTTIVKHQQTQQVRKRKKSATA